MKTKRLLSLTKKLNYSQLKVLLYLSYSIDLKGIWRGTAKEVELETGVKVRVVREQCFPALEKEQLIQKFKTTQYKVIGKRRYKIYSYAVFI